MNRIILSAAAALLLVGGTAVCAKEAEKPKMPTASFSGSSLSFSTKSVARNTSVSISGPSGFTLRKFSKTGMPQIDLNQRGNLKDGLYLYEITTATGELELVKDNINNGRGDNDSHWVRKGITKSGHFRVVNGVIKQYKNSKEPASSIDY
jgi:hypothetical protein